ncbi:MAG TPA: hypothetical protein VGJ55_11350 [Pyrinomonadaceae bacterium]|jgi:hypothetical protein
MALIGANELKRKLLIDVEGQPYVVLEVFPCFADGAGRGHNGAHEVTPPVDRRSYGKEFSFQREINTQTGEVAGRA